MRYLLVLLILLCSTAQAGTVELDRAKITYDDALSLRDFTNWEFKSRPKYEFSGKTVYASNFSSQVIDAHIFPENMTGVTFVKCNLMNVYMPPGNTVVQCNQTRFKVQNDNKEWIIDGSNKPIEPLNREQLISDGKNIDPAKIPTKKQVIA